MANPQVKAVITAEDNASKTINNVGASFAKMTGAVAAGQAVYAGVTKAISGLKNALEDSVSTTVDWTRGTKKLQRELGVTAEVASSLQAVGSRFGLSVDDLSKSFGIFAKQVTGAAQGNEEMIKTFSHFGLSVKDAKGHVKDFNGLFGEVADKFKNAPAGFDKTAEAMKLFGRSGKDMLPLLNLGSQGIKDLTAKAEKYGLVLTQTNVDAVSKYIAAQKDMAMATTGVKLQIGNALMPVLAELANKLSAFVSSDKFREWLKKLTDWLSTELPKALKWVYQSGIPLLQNALKTLKPVLEAFTSAFTWLVDYINNHNNVIWVLVGAFVALKTALAIVGFVNSLTTAMIALTGATTLAGAAIAIFTSPITLIIAAVALAVGVITWLVLKWGELSTGVKIAVAIIFPFLTLFALGIRYVIDHFAELKNFVLVTLPAAITTAFNFVVQKVIWLKDNFWSVIGFIIGFVATLPIKLPMYIALAIQGMVNLIRSVNWAAVFSSIWQGMQSVWDKITSIVNNAWHFIHDLSWSDIFMGIGKSIGNAIMGLIEGAINGALSGIPGSPKVHIPRFANGVQNFGGGVALVGERGPELVNLPKGSSVTPNNQLGGVVGGGGNITINVNVGMYAGSEMEKRRVAEALFDALKDVAGSKNTSVAKMMGA